MLWPRRSITTSKMTRSAFASGFTLTELLVVLAIIGLLAGLLSPALARAKSRAQSVSCLNNLRQIQLAWLGYVHDNDDLFPPNISRKVGFDQINVVVDGRVPWVLGNAKLDTNAAAIERGALFKYIDSVATFRCPADISTVRDSSLRRTRSYSMSQYFNLDVVSDSALDGIPGSEFNLRKLAQLLNPGPSRTWVFLDEHEISIDDGVFGFQVPRPPDPGGSWIWGAFPGDRHNNAANVSFADGHVEGHRWRAHRTVTSFTGGMTPIRSDDAANLEDQHWLWDRLPRPQ
jgi:prepilin-type processing-associated H-X9-DG protein/prepilin-type N-terminal cleavage/methylation domain-containing protein